jgi:hypothetical protein
VYGVSHGILPDPTSYVTLSQIIYTFSLEAKAISGADGTVTIWDVSNEAPKLAEIVRGLIPAAYDPK